MKRTKGLSQFPVPVSCRWCIGFERSCCDNASCVPLASHAHDLRCPVYVWQINDSPTTCLASCSKQSNISLSEGVACKTYVPNCEFWMCHASKHNFRLGRQRRKVTWIHVRSEVILLNCELLNHGRMSRWGQWVLPPEADGFNKYLQFASKKGTSCLAF